MTFLKLSGKGLVFLLFILASSLTQAKERYIILMAGQSNMAGRGASRVGIDDVTYENIVYLKRDSTWGIAKNPLHWDKSAAGVGMGIPFAHALLEKLGGDYEIGLVPCAAGGTTIGDWTNNAWFSFCSIYLYTNLINRAKVAAKSGTIVGMIWHQGESDAFDNLYPNYQKNVETLFQKIRTDLNLPNLPIVAGELGTYLTSGGYPRWDSINVRINRMKSTCPNYDVASSAGLTPNADNVHFTSASQAIMGIRYAEKFYPLAFEKAAIKEAVNEPFKLTISTNFIHFSLNSKQSTSIKIYNLLGKVVKSTILNDQECDVPTGSLKGLYLVKIFTENESFSKKVML